MKAFAKVAVPASSFCQIGSRLAFRTSQHCPLPTRDHRLLLSRLRYSIPNKNSHFSSSSRSWSQRIPEDPHVSLIDPVLSSPDAAFTSKNRKISCAYFDGTGTLVSKQKEFTKDEIAEKFDLRHRDLRDIDLKSEAVTRILVRPATILLQFFDLCIIIQSDEALLIDLKKSETDRSSVFYRDFEQRLSGVQEAADVPELPYELRAVEAALVAVLSILREDLIEARQEAEHNAQHLKLESGFVAVGLDLLFEHSRRLGKIEQKARLLRNTFRELLDTDEDLAGMYLSDRFAGRLHKTSDHQEAEYMLEAYHKAADGLVESAHAAISTIRKKENIFRSSLAVQRNQIMFLEARIAIHTLGLAAGTLVAGLFGMNLVNFIEDSPYGFIAITGVCVALSALFSMYGMKSIRRIQTLKEIQDQRFSQPGKRI
jgi:magnesium transporter